VCMCFCHDRLEKGVGEDKVQGGGGVMLHFAVCTHNATMLLFNMFKLD